MSNIDTIKDSFLRCDESGAFSETFYEIFLGKSEEIRDMFKDTDFAKQKKLLRATVKILATKPFGDPKTVQILSDVARTHNRQGYDIAPHHYELWLDSLCETVARHDPEYSPQLEEMWREHMAAPIGYITARY